jgi:hypothetical protein
MCVISNLSDDYPSVAMEGQFQDSNSITVNRWRYTSGKYDPFKGFFLSVSKKAKHNWLYNSGIQFDTVEKLSDLFLEMYNEDQQNDLIRDVTTHFDLHKRMLIRSHGHFIGFANIFPLTLIRNITIIPESHIWYKYIKLLVMIKINLVPFEVVPKTKESTILLNNFVWPSWGLAKRVYGEDNIIPKLDYKERVDCLLEGCSVIYSHSIIGLIDPLALGYKMSYDRSLKKVLSVNPVTFNSKDYLWNRTPVGKVTQELQFRSESIKKWERCKPIVASVRGEAHRKFIGLNEFLFGDAAATIFNIDPDAYTEAILKWHNKNIELIQDLQEEIGVHFIDEECRQVWRVK